MAPGSSVSGGGFHAPVVQTGTFNGGVHTYYGPPQHTGLSPVADWPRLDAADPIAFGVRRTRRIGDAPPLPPYVARDDDALLEKLVCTAAETGGPVLVTGEPLSGKSRTAWVRMLANLPGATRLLAPAAGTDLRGLPARTPRPFRGRRHGGAGTGRPRRSRPRHCVSGTSGGGR